MRLVLDTNVLIDGLVPTGTGDEAAISMATLAELRFGVLIARTAESRSARMRVLSSAESALAALPIDDAVASSYALLATKTVAAGRQPRARAFDLLIAATAHAHGAALVTRNIDDFTGLDDVLDVRLP
ncbi:PIN domain-containing protein [Cellulomonas xiejunii]|uniref:Ribonuclease VapC n=1 Tax=Cellulomonas xiejunii TaxID=2968083 RepID=A0ABY5KNF0_9CELL|nr:PIN domain-containing protein [Cellulomonas xiejunii]MCC2321217.1 PIN domain-containing protein [Cellulomonas xiejunii]UUI71804.1 PIN domain-containing protein [Cellulomonas xiejunii]